MIVQVVLPDGLIRPCLDILLKLTPNEKDFVRLIVEIIDELRDPISEAECLVRGLLFFYINCLNLGCSNNQVFYFKPKS